MIEISVNSVRINLTTQQRVIILKATGQERYIFIWIGQSDAEAVAQHLEGTHSSRPLTHDLMNGLIEAAGAKVIRGNILDFSDNIYYAQVILDVAGKEVAIDARPSDAIALALCTKTPMFITEQLLDRVSVVLEAAASNDNTSTSPTDPDKEMQDESNKEI